MGTNIYNIDLINIEDRWEAGVQRGSLLGFYSMNDAFSVKLGSTLYLFGEPYTGKTQVKYEFLLQLSELYGWNHVIYDPETGSAEDIKELLIEMYAMGDFTDDYHKKMSLVDRTKAEIFLNKHFYIIDPKEEDITLKSFYEKVDEIEQSFNIKIHTTSIDPWDYLKHDFKEFEDSGRDDRYLMEALKYVQRNAKQNNRYNIIVTHTRDIPVSKSKEGVFFSPPPTANDFAFGKEWFRKGMAIVGTWRPAEGLLNEHGKPYEWNETILLFCKMKPKGTAAQGSRIKKLSIFYDPKKHRYYEQYHNQIRFSKPTEREYESNKGTTTDEWSSPF